MRRGVNSKVLRSRVARTVEVIYRFVIHLELGAFQNEIFWKGVASSDDIGSLRMKWRASLDSRRARRVTAAESSQPSSLIRFPSPRSLL